MKGVIYPLGLVFLSQLSKLLPSPFLSSAASSVEKPKAQAEPAFCCMYLVVGREREINEMKEGALPENNRSIQFLREPLEMGSLFVLASPFPPQPLLPYTPSLQLCSPAPTHSPPL